MLCLLIIALFYSNRTLFADKLITLFLKPYPYPLTTHTEQQQSEPMVRAGTAQEASQKLAPKLHKVGKLASHLSKHILPASVSGIFATYGGFLTVSDLNGEISFPLLHKSPFLYLLITERLAPIIMAGNTISHWELQEGVPAELYRMEQKYDADSRLDFWEVSQEPLPKNNRVPLESLALFADPKYIYVPLGATIFTHSPHLILPDIYVKKGLNLTEQALFILNLTSYFGSILPIYKKEKTRYSTHLTY